MTWVSQIQYIFLLGFLLLFVSFGADVQQWKKRSIYFLLTDRFNGPDQLQSLCTDLSSYCGGTFSGITEQLDYIQSLGFDAIWLTPVIDNTPGGYHGYWARDLYKINSNYGSAEDLKNLVTAAHMRNMYVMVDVVANHVGYPSPEDVNFEEFPQFEADDFHDCSVCNEDCSPSDWNDKTQIETCRLAGLPDLDQSRENVRITLYEWIQWLITEFEFDGMRIDTVKHVQEDFWSNFVESAGVFAIGEVFNGDPSYLAKYKDSMSLLSFPMYYTLQDVFSQQQSMYLVQQRMEEYQQNFPNQMDVLGTFLDNHDVPRFLHEQPNEALFMNALVYVILGRGIPIIYYGTEHGFSGGSDPQNREIMWPFGFNTSSTRYAYLISSSNQIRKNFELWNKDQSTISISDDCYIFSRGPSVVVALTNVASSVSCPISLKYKFCDINDQVQIFDQKSSTIELRDGNPRILVSCDQLLNIVVEGTVEGETEMTSDVNQNVQEQTTSVGINVNTSLAASTLSYQNGQVIINQSYSSTFQTSSVSTVPLTAKDRTSIWKSRMIYQLLTDRFAPTLLTEEVSCKNLNMYCGGTFQGIIRRLDYIQELGFDAIWISPVVENTANGYHGYWASNFSRINPMFGDEQNLKMLVEEAHKRDMLVMLDVVANHMGYGPSGEQFLNVFYPPFKSTNFHDCQSCDSYCSIRDWDDEYQVEHCRLAGLPDLNQTDPVVREFLLNWVSGIVTKYGFDGIRIDTVKNVARDFWPLYSTAAGVFSIGEVFTFDLSLLDSYKDTMDSLLYYPMQGVLRGVFGEQQDMQLLQQTRSKLLSLGFNPGLLGVFLENHDLPRFLSFQPNTSLYLNALAYVILGEGIPILYYGSEQGFNGNQDPTNREPLWRSSFDTSGMVYKYIQKLTSVRNAYELWKESLVELTVSESCYSFQRGSIVVVLTNAGKTVPCSVSFNKQDAFNDTTELCQEFFEDVEISYEDGPIEVLMDNGLPQVVELCQS
eukprot:TRINITY_DN21871_c0_g1_i3.p1 TRINITY_DN21871_c0_g1~~TRINITY_DN21871_c0_g1_i3.p1  ORF type:complete len:1000 (-),score=74.15 TRINITY_DN21871_c0_g1_i3:199-3174(-)